MTFCIRSRHLQTFYSLYRLLFSVEKIVNRAGLPQQQFSGCYESPEFGHEILYEIISANIVAKDSEGHLSLTSKTIIDITTYWSGFQVVIYVISVQHPA